MTVAEERAIRLVLAGVSDPVIVELGANTGEDGPIFERCCSPGAKLFHIAVEPDPRNVALFHHHPVAAMRKLSLVQGACADANGYREFHTCYNTRDTSHASGSLLNPTGHLVHFDFIKFEEAIRVNCHTLDTLFAMHGLTKIDLLYVDVQGAERLVIAGGQRALKRTRYAFMEAEPEVELYEGEALKPELIGIMDGIGFEVAGDFGYNVMFWNTRFE